jgi:hypothetical protein
VAGAAYYEVYYAPNVTETPSIPAAPAVTAVTASATITATDIGNDTMNYYVWVKAANAIGKSAPSWPASTLDRFMGTWTAGFGDYFCITNADVLYDNDQYPGHGVFGYVRAIIPFNNGGSVNFNSAANSGPAGVIIVEYDDSYMSDESSWSWAGAPNYFNAVYYYGLSGSGTGAAAYLGWPYDVDGTEVDSVDAAIAKFTFDARNTYINVAYAAEYEWSE